jgi:hypothetical protein
MANSWTNAKTKSRKAASYIYEEMREGGPIGLVAYIVLVVLIGVFCKVISVNVAPYLIVFGETAPKASGIPIIGWFYDILNLLTSASAAMLAWFALNLGQCLWILLGFDTNLHRQVLARMTAEKKIQDLEGAVNSQSIRSMRRKSLKLPSFIFIYSGWISLGCYVGELVLHLKAYPPVNNPAKFFTSLALGKFEIFSAENIMKMLWGMFSTEVFVVVIVLAFVWAKSQKSPQSPNEDY